MFFLYGAPHSRHLLSFPTRRSSDLHSSPHLPPCPFRDGRGLAEHHVPGNILGTSGGFPPPSVLGSRGPRTENRSEEHTSELQSRGHLVCRLLLEKKKTALTTIADDY